MRTSATVAGRRPAARWRAAPKRVRVAQLGGGAEPLENVREHGLPAVAAHARVGTVGPSAALPHR
jgi:hypothetical protein